MRSSAMRKAVDEGQEHVRDDVSDLEGVRKRDALRTFVDGKVRTDLREGRGLSVRNRERSKVSQRVDRDG